VGRPTARPCSSSCILCPRSSSPPPPKIHRLTASPKCRSSSKPPPILCPSSSPQAPLHDSLPRRRVSSAQAPPPDGEIPTLLPPADPGLPGFVADGAEMADVDLICVHRKGGEGAGV
jgi:hypothetical protein